MLRTSRVVFPLLGLVVLLACPDDSNAWWRRREDSSSSASIHDPCKDGPCASNKSPKQSSFPAANGCGSGQFSLALTMLPASLYPGFDPCCRTHDYCYADCYKTKAVCDQNFLSCMRKSCADDYFCRGEAYIFYSAVKNFGCIAYRKTISNNCLCI